MKDNLKKEKDAKILNEEEIVGAVYSNLGTANNLHGIDMMTATNKGHGFAAEYANHLDDKIKNLDFLGEENVKLVGGDNAKNGADRLVNGFYIQTKYCETASKSVNETFGKDGFFKYFTENGEPMKIEVPKDQYPEAIEKMKKKILEGKVYDEKTKTKITDPEQAKDIIKEGGYTYKQAKNIAKAGNVDSIMFDAKNAAIISTGAAGITFSISFAMALTTGKSIDEALDLALESSIKIFTISFAGSVLTSQLQRIAVINSVSGDVAKSAVKLMGTKNAQFIANALRNSGKNIYGAAAIKNVEKMLKGNIVTSAATVAITSVPDAINTFRGRVSGAQLFKNMTNTTASVAGGTAGWAGGAVAGAAIGSAVPVIGTAAGAVIGKFVGSMVGGFAAGKTAKLVTDQFIEDDAKEMQRILNDVFKNLAYDYLLVEEEAKLIFEKLNLTASILKDMYASEDREKFATNLMEPTIEEVVKNRKKVSTADLDYEEAVLKFIEKNLEVEEDISNHEIVTRLSLLIEKGIIEDSFDIDKEIIDDLEEITKMSKEESDKLTDNISKKIENLLITEDRFKDVSSKILSVLTEKYMRMKVEYIFIQVLKKYKVKYKETQHREYKKNIVNTISLIIGQDLVGVDVQITKEFLDSLINLSELSKEDYEECIAFISANLREELSKDEVKPITLKRKIRDSIIDERASDNLCRIIGRLEQSLLIKPDWAKFNKEMMIAKGRKFKLF